MTLFPVTLSSSASIGTIVFLNSGKFFLAIALTFGNLTVSGDITADNWKQEGTNFTGSLLLGHATTGSLNAATYNTGVGLTALDALTSGDENTAVGYQAADALTT